MAGTGPWLLFLHVRTCAMWQWTQSLLLSRGQQFKARTLRERSCPSILSEGPRGGQDLRLVFLASTGPLRPNCLASSGPALVA